MNELQIFLQRRRKMLTQLVAIVALGLAGVLAILPRADAHVTSAAAGDPRSILLSPAPISGEQFAVFYAVPHR